MDKKEYSVEELEKILNSLNIDYFLMDLWEIKDSFLKYSQNMESIHPRIKIGLYLIYILAGRLEDAQNILDNCPVNSKIDQFILESMYLVMPTLTVKEFRNHIGELRKIGYRMQNLTFTAGRPSLINGFKDFTCYGAVLKQKKQIFIDALQTLYGDPAEAMFNVACAEYNYQTDRCLEAMLNIVEYLPVLEKSGDMRVLFVALCLRMQILVVTGEVDSAAKLMVELRQRISKHGSAELIYNIDALETKIAIYEGNFDIINNWMENLSPDEHGDFCMLDLYRYFIKLRCYILNEKYMAGLVLTEKLRPYLKASHRFMDLCEMDFLLAIGGYKAKVFEETFSALERSLKLVKKYKYYRLAADEGEPMLKVLNAYKKAKPNSVYIELVDKLIVMAKKTAVLYPNYLLSPFKKHVTLTINEKNILNCLTQGMTYDEISGQTNVSINTVRYHIKKIYERLEVNSASEAIARAKSLGLI